MRTCQIEAREQLLENYIKYNGEFLDTMQEKISGYSRFLVQNGLKELKLKKTQ